MNIHELTQRVYNETAPEDWQVKHINRLLATSQYALGLNGPGSGYAVDVDDGMARFVHLLHLLAEDSPNNGAINRLTQDQLAHILAEAGAETAVPGDLLVIEFRGSYHTVNIYDPTHLAEAFVNVDNGVTAYRIVRIP